MKLISKFQDYYDCVLALDEDHTMPFIRKTKSMPRKDVLSLTEGKPYDIRSSNGTYNSGFFDSDKMDDYMSTNAFVIVVNGKVYPGVQESYDFDTGNRTTYMWHIKSQREEYYKTMYFSKYKYNKKLPEVDEEKFESYVLPKLQELGKIEVDSPYHQIHVKGIEIPTKSGGKWGDYHVDRMQARVCNITYYPILKEYSFANIIDPYTMYQEIDMWFGTHANPDNAQVPVGDDETLAEAKGFDRKFSFRKAPGKKKRGKK